MLISDGNITRDKERYHIMIKLQIARKILHFKNVSYLYNLCIKNKGAIRWSRQIYHSIWDFIIPFLVTDIKGRGNISKAMEDLNNTINEFDLMGVCRQLQPTSAEHSSFKGTWHMCDHPPFTKPHSRSQPISRGH